MNSIIKYHTVHNFIFSCQKFSLDLLHNKTLNTMNINPDKITFHLHTNHNSDCDILVYQINDDTNVTYGLYILDNKEFCEVYIGENYNTKSSKKSWSKVYYGESYIPKKYTKIWKELKKFYIENQYLIELM